MDSPRFTQKKNRQFLVPIRKLFRTRIFVYFLCVLISFSIWVSLSLSQQHSHTLDFEINFSKHPENFTLVNQPKNTIHLTIQSSGYEYYDLNKKKNRILNFDISTITLKQAGNQYIGILTANDFMSEIYSQLTLEGSITQITPDSIFFIYEKNCFKNVPVFLDADYQLSPQFWVSSPPIITPNTITVSGFSKDLDSITAVKTAYQNFKSLSDTLHQPLALVKPETIYPIKFSTDSVTLTIPVEQFTEKIIEIPIYTEISNPAYKIKTFPNKITVSCLVSLKNYRTVADSLFTAKVIYNEITDKGKNMLPVQIICQKDYIKISKVIPEKVEYILIK